MRMLLIHGARSILLRAHGAGTATGFQLCARALQKRRGHNVSTVAVANRLARIIWAVWTPRQPCAADYRATTPRAVIPPTHQEDCAELN